MEGLLQPAAIQWAEDGAVTIEATSEADLFAALGYVHGVDNAWAMSLWRKAALGELSQWLGDDYVEHDRHARMLGFAMLAEGTYRTLPEEEKIVVDAYANGATTALTSSAVAQQDEFVLLELQPGPWLPWHTLAVERMISWMGTGKIRADSSLAPLARADSALIRFSTADSLFRSVLHIGAADQSRAWTARMGSTTIVAQQLVSGNSALPLIHEITMRVGSQGTLVGTVPGTLMLPSGQSGERAWSVFLTGDVSLVSTDSLPPPPLYDRLADRDGNEMLLTFLRSDEGLYFKAEPPAPSPTALLASVDSLGEAAIARDNRLADSLRIAFRVRTGEPRFKAPPAWLLSWRGFERGSDLNAWRALLSGSQPIPLTLIRGDGQLTTSSGEQSILGSPPIQIGIPGGTFVASDASARFVANRLAGVLGAADSTTNRTEQPNAETLVLDAYSPWAASLTPYLVQRLGHRDSLDATVKDAYAFLRGWDYQYDRGSIGASIFEGWVTEYRRKMGRLPTALPDSGTTVILQQTLSDAIEQIQAEHGNRASDWRWELVQPGRRFFPIWNDSSRGAPPPRYAPLTASLGGHPTTVLHGPSIVLDGFASSSVWMSWTLTSDWTATYIFHTVTPSAGFLARELESDEAISSYVVRRNTDMSSPLYLRPRD